MTSSFITFWLEWNAVPARVMIGNFIFVYNATCLLIGFWAPFRLLLNIDYIHFSIIFRRNNNAQFFHDVQRFPIDAPGGVQSDGDERLGRGVYVLYLRVLARVRLRQLRGTQKALAQRSL